MPLRQLLHFAPSFALSPLHSPGMTHSSSEKSTSLNPNVKQNKSGILLEKNINYVQ